MLIIYVCDSVMGSGKTQSAISYMNENPQKKYIYITPYLEEAERIRKGCPDLHFVSPSNRVPEYHFRKVEHTAALIKEGRNIATTHAAFKTYEPEMLDDINRQEYILFIDESVDVLERCTIPADDFQLAVDAGYVENKGGTFTLTNRTYEGHALRKLIALIKTRDFMSSQDVDGSTIHYWLLPPEFVMSFKDIFVLTYLFEGQSLHHFFKIYDMPYKYIGTEPSETSATGYDFVRKSKHVPDYLVDIKDKVQIQTGILNNIGEPRCALSVNWFNTASQGDLDRLKKNLYNFLINRNRNTPPTQKLWGTYKSAFSALKGQGYTRAYLNFAAKSTNAYQDRTLLAYLANVFMNTSDKNFYKSRGINVDEDCYALSVMLQWIFRSAIRVGEPIKVYVPSRRMRELLLYWLDDLRYHKLPKHKKLIMPSQKATLDNVAEDELDEEDDI